MDLLTTARRRPAGRRASRAERQAGDPGAQCCGDDGDGEVGEQRAPAPGPSTRSRVIAARLPVPAGIAERRRVAVPRLAIGLARLRTVALARRAWSACWHPVTGPWPAITGFWPTRAGFGLAVI